ncbi:inactive serine protease 35-like [Genypterus blacodes]|uniref:inactive serine protease 35-like n=1 Tax=Genypterus blacodes TaxID=154954 RepID=UPI003F777A99
MGSKHLPCLLLCAALLTVSLVCSHNGNNESDRWSRQSLPVLLDTHTVLLHTSSYRGQESEEQRGGAQSMCGIECQSALPRIDQIEQERILGYETVYENGTRTHTDIALQGFNLTSPRPHTHTRRKRQVYGSDGRFVISDWHFSTNFPFSAAVRLSTGCSGIQVSPKHVLTAAHCVHDGGDYLGGVRRLRVGMLQLRANRRRGGRRRGGRRRSGSKGEKETGEGLTEEEGEEQNSIDGEPVRGRKGGQSRRRRVRKDGEQGAADGGHVGESGRGRGGPGRRSRLNRAPRSAEPSKRPVFRWTRVKQIQIPQGWIHTKTPSTSVSPDYDYALLELRRPVKQKHMELGVAPTNAPLARIHFSGYDSDKSLLDGQGNEKVVYRFCEVAKESDHLMYQHCDAQQGASGAGVYIRLRQEVGDGKGKWQRRVIGVFSGHRWVEVEGGHKREYNVAVRITPAKYAQICHWIHGDSGLCKEV